MSEKELADYEFQLAQVESSLQLMPNRSDLIVLRDSLRQAVDMIRESIAQSKQQSSVSSSVVDKSKSDSAKKTSKLDKKSVESVPGITADEYDTKELNSSTPHSDIGAPPASAQKEPSPITKSTSQSKKWSVGDIVEAKWSQNGRWYEARVEGWNPLTSQYSVTFTGYGSSEFVGEDAVRESIAVDASLDSSKPIYASTAGSNAKKKKAYYQSTGALGGSGAPVAKKKKQTFEEYVAKKEAEHAVKQNAWLQFKQSSTPSSLSLKKEKRK